jgi:hypothetical protein
MPRPDVWGELPRTPLLSTSVNRMCGYGSSRDIGSPRHLRPRCVRGVASGGPYSPLGPGPRGAWGIGPGLGYAEFRERIFHALW